MQLAELVLFSRQLQVSQAVFIRMLPGPSRHDQLMASLDGPSAESALAFLNL